MCRVTSGPCYRTPLRSSCTSWRFILGRIRNHNHRRTIVRGWGIFWRRAWCAKCLWQFVPLTPRSGQEVRRVGAADAQGEPAEGRGREAAEDDGGAGRDCVVVVGVSFGSACTALLHGLVSGVREARREEWFIYSCSVQEARPSDGRLIDPSILSITLTPSHLWVRWSI